jgi:hypothetical protein
MMIVNIALGLRPVMFSWFMFSDTLFYEVHFRVIVTPYGVTSIYLGKFRLAECQSNQFTNSAAKNFTHQRD